MVLVGEGVFAFCFCLDCRKAHQKGVGVVAVFPQDVAETKATRATEIAKSQGFPLLFTTEPEE